jgi:hypothetical protein
VVDEAVKAAEGASKPVPPPPTQPSSERLSP